YQHLFSSTLPPPPRPTLFPYTTLFRSSKENVRSIGYSIYYTMVNIGGASGPYVASWAHRHLGVENVFRVAALSVFLMFFAVLIRSEEHTSELQSRGHLVCRLLLEKKKK